MVPGHVLSIGLMVKVFAESFELLAPETLVVCDPVVDLFERLGAKTIAALAAHASHGDQARMAQDAQVLRDRRTRHAEGLREPIDGLLTGTEEVEESAAGGLANGGENVGARAKGGAEGTHGSAGGEAGASGRATHGRNNR